MLVIISDLHLTDQTTGTSVGKDAFEILIQKIQDIAEKASWRTNDFYQSIEHLDILLLGDIFDLIRSTKWNESDSQKKIGSYKVRPWKNLDTPKGLDILHRITTEIIDKNKEGLSKFREIADSDPSTKKIIIPKELSNGKLNGQSIVNVNIYYMVGNHDWFYYLPKEKYNDLRKKVADAIGLSNPYDQPFPHDPTEFPQLNSLLIQHKTYACHGDKFDKYNFRKNRSQSSLGDAIVIELINMYPQNLKKLGLPPMLINELKEIDNVRPLALVPLWIYSLIENTIFSEAKKLKAKDEWKELIKKFLNNDFVQSLDKDYKFDPTEYIEISLYAAKIEKIAMKNSFQKLAKKMLNYFDDFDEMVEEESERHPYADYFVYGHTHYQKVVPLKAEIKNKQFVDKFYFNSGTWKPIHQLPTINNKKSDSLDISSNRFVKYNVMSFVTIFKNDERKGRKFETWSGTLD